ncbi:potassium-transporting ATPase subunit C [Streptomyces sp. NPDC005046]
MTRIPHWLAQHLAALRVVIVLTLLTGLAYPLAMTAVARAPGLDGTSEVTGADGKDAGSSLIRPVLHRRQGQPAQAVLPVPALQRRYGIRRHRVRGR